MLGHCKFIPPPPQYVIRLPLSSWVLIYTPWWGEALQQYMFCPRTQHSDLARSQI